MKLIANALIVVGFCVAAIGAAGFDKKIESEAIPLFACGIVALAIGAILGKAAKKSSDTTESAPQQSAEVRWQVERIRDIVIGLDERSNELAPEQMCKEIDSLLRNEYFDLASRNEEIANTLGFTDYAKIWDGVAIAERLLARVWSISTDGHHEEALVSLPEARQHIERAATAAAQLAPGSA